MSEKDLKTDLTSEECERFLSCARVGRLGVIIDEGPYVVPVGFCYADGKIFFHTCNKGLKVQAVRENPNVCFEADEALSDATMYKSVVVFGRAEIIEDEKKMIPFLQKIIDKYQVPTPFEEYMSRPERRREELLEAVRICVVTPKKMTGRKVVKAV